MEHADDPGTQFQNVALSVRDGPAPFKNNENLAAKGIGRVAGAVAPHSNLKSHVSKDLGESSLHPIGQSLLRRERFKVGLDCECIESLNHAGRLRPS